MKHKVHLSTEQKQELVDMLKKGSSTARTIRRAHRLLMASEGKIDKIISETLQISITTVEKTSPENKIALYLRQARVVKLTLQNHFSYLFRENIFPVPS
ncbi:MAG: hypothetical protein F6K22_31410 [Okeania sp. SIO2F4]|uniref:hypothetical protein n=1 Tax=Okeania sp. SIO2F4 TaxID=2607790 RepID=UPI001429C412|nr:hypothetical protein [Okeania sp. SIO2F4]NES06927.1 hypothetical protein [Okeania sp. SIO2F4]